MRDKDLSRPKRALIVAAAIGAVSLVAWQNRFVQDDAFISFRYAEHLATGEGLVWNPAERIEGYTNFLWVLLLGGAIKLGFNPIEASYILGIASFTMSLALCFRIAVLLTQSFVWSVLIMLATGLNYTFSCYATGGLETQLHAALVLACIAALIRCIKGAASRRLIIGTSVLIALAMMVRPDSGLLVLVACVSVCYPRVGLAERWQIKYQPLFWLLGPLLILVGSWLAWKYCYYGDIVPNTFYAKTGGPRVLTLIRGVWYVSLFLATYWLLFYLILGLVYRKALRRRLGVDYLPPILFLVLWVGYVCVVGGDIMEFRLLVPVIPFFMLFAVLTIKVLPQRTISRVFCLSVLLAANLVHANLFGSYVYPPGIGTIPGLRKSMSDDNITGWPVLGRILGRALQGEPAVTIAVMPAGAIPYYSKLRTVDMLGLNDKWVATQGFERENCVVCAGHRRIATVEYLRSRNVNLVIGQPQRVKSEDAARDPWTVVRNMFYGEAVDYEVVPEKATLVVIPVGGGIHLAALYLAMHDRIEELIATGEWNRVELDPFPGRL